MVDTHLNTGLLFSVYSVIPNFFQKYFKNEHRVTIDVLCQHGDNLFISTLGKSASQTETANASTY
jgi:hypothetical protein